LLVATNGFEPINFSALTMKPESSLWQMKEDYKVVILAEKAMVWPKAATNPTHGFSRRIPLSVAKRL
jgi:hypothetical protein